MAPVAVGVVIWIFLMLEAFLLKGIASLNLRADLMLLLTPVPLLSGDQIRYT